MKRKLSDWRDDLIAGTCNFLLKGASRDYQAFVSVIMNLGREGLEKELTQWQAEEQ